MLSGSTSVERGSARAGRGARAERAPLLAPGRAGRGAGRRAGLRGRAAPARRAVPLPRGGALALRRARAGRRRPLRARHVPLSPVTSDSYRWTVPPARKLLKS